MNQTDSLKLLQLQEEKKHINEEFIETLARQLISELVEWANDQIFAPLGGELTFDITLGPPNAGVGVGRDRPYHPHMEFRSSLISNIYADAFTFPIISRRLERETDTIADFHESDERFRDCALRFDSALPALREADVAPIFRQICERFVELNQTQRNDERQLQPDDVRCRFIMFELMLAWTFFHELGHAVQGHQNLRNQKAQLSDQEFFFEMESAVPGHGTSAGEMGGTSAPAEQPPDLPAQARELLADADATDQILKYLVVGRRLNFSVWYLLLCSTGCMFQRFYTSYREDFELAPAKHPHPAIRDEASALHSLNWIADYLVASKNVSSREDAAVPLAYINVRASVITGLFRAHRMEKREGPDELPSYMRLLSSKSAQRRTYIRALIPEIERQLPAVLEHHLIDDHSLEYWIFYLKAASSRIGEAELDDVAGSS